MYHLKMTIGRLQREQPLLDSECGDAGKTYGFTAFGEQLAVNFDNSCPQCRDAYYQRRSDTVSLIGRRGP